jgi:hypothetical protein
MKAFNLKKQSRRDPPTAFNPYTPERTDPYRMNVGKPGSEDTVDKLRAGDTSSAVRETPGGGSPWSTNLEWPTDQPFITDNEGRPKHENGLGLDTGFGSDLHDDYEGQNGDSSSESVLGKNSTVSRMLSNDRDRKPYNVNSVMTGGVLQGIRKRLRNI